MNVYVKLYVKFIIKCVHNNNDDDDECNDF